MINKKKSEANRLSMTIVLAGALFISGFVSSVQADTLPQDLLDKLPEIQAAWGDNPVIVAAVVTHNARNIPMSDILELDEQWRAAESEEWFMLDYLENDVAEELNNLAFNYDFVVESFVMGNQGGLVAATNQTSDYWQGDEAKFTESFVNGKGNVHVGDVEYDESAGSYLVQISVPVMKDGAAIGAITIGVDVGTFE